MTTRTDSMAKRTSMLSGLEKQLSSSFKPVAPDGDFVNRLRDRLASTPSLCVEEDRTQGVFLGLLGILVVIVGLIVGRRLWKYLFPPEPPV